MNEISNEYKTGEVAVAANSICLFEDSGNVEKFRSYGEVVIGDLIGKRSNLKFS